MLYVRNMDKYETRDACFADIEDVPEDIRVRCMMLDAAADDNGTACINYVGRRDNVAGDTYYFLASKWAAVGIKVERRKKGRVLMPTVSNTPQE